MRVLEQLEPQKVFQYFEEICQIPHGSGNIEAISNYLVAFAKEHQLQYIQDEYGNVIMIKEATEGYENEEPVMLQGHMDMVTVKKPELSIDMEKDALMLDIDGDFIYAKGTSLGGDDGIAVAYALALLDSDTYKHPRLEAVITVDEEVGMDGARAIDLSKLKAKRLLNLDSEEEGIFWCSCAGGARVDCRLPVERVKREGVLYGLKVTGLQGGHSGTEIHRERGNANCLMARLLQELSSGVEISLYSIQGGLADNAIPRETEAVVMIRKEDNATFAELVDVIENKFKQELSTKDSGVRIEAGLLEDGAEKEVVTGKSLRKVIALLNALPNGVQAMSGHIKGLVETSLNLGILKLEKELQVEYSVRSSIESAKKHLIDKITSVIELAGGNTTISGDYPGWEYLAKSPLRDKAAAIYTEMFGKEPQIAAVHAGLECGIIASKISDLDGISMGPDILNIHTTEEKLSISSTKRVWDFLVKILETKDN